MQHQPCALHGFSSLSHDLEALALRAIEAQLRDRHPLVVLFSAGKNSSVLANLALTAATNVAARGEPAPVIVSHADVGVENPEIHDLAEAEVRKMAAFAKARGVAPEVRIVLPALADSFAVRVIGGRALPAFPDSRRDCTTDWKRRPAERALAALQQASGCAAPAACLLPATSTRPCASTRQPAAAAALSSPTRRWTSTRSPAPAASAAGHAPRCRRTARFGR